MARAGDRLRVAVIGAGMIGVTAACFLRRKGHEVKLVDPNQPGEGASFGNAGCFNGSSVVPLSMPGSIRNVFRWLSDPLGPLALPVTYLPSIAPWLIRFIRAGTPIRVAAQARALRMLLEDGIETLAPLLHEAGASDLVQRVGHLFVYRTLAGWQNEQAAWRLRADNGIHWDEFEAAELRQLDPNLSREYRKGVLVRENGHTVNPHRLVNSLAAAFQRAGGLLLKQRAIGFEVDGGRLKAIRCEDACLDVDAAVIAAGIWSRPLAAQLGDRVPLETERGYHIMIRDPEVAPRIPVADAAGKFVATPMELGLRLAGTVELAGLKAPPNWQRARVLLAQARRMYPALCPGYAEDRLSMWMGHRPSLPDSLPIIGASRKTSDVVYAFGHGHIGMACAAKTGRTVAEIVSGETPQIDVAAFSPRRFV
jgi:D-amino-acid dehydrogenase